MFTLKLVFCNFLGARNRFFIRFPARDFTVVVNELKALDVL
tara:strand:- start:3462 stop:3584 length:123 start_codon:yes stop_codon:yes gene_type:complete